MSISISLRVEWGMLIKKLNSEEKLNFLFHSVVCYHVQRQFIYVVEFYEGGKK